MSKLVGQRRSNIESCVKSPNGRHSVYYLDEEDMYDGMVRCVWCKKTWDDYL